MEGTDWLKHRSVTVQVGHVLSWMRNIEAVFGLPVGCAAGYHRRFKTNQEVENYYKEYLHTTLLTYTVN